MKTKKNKVLKSEVNRNSILHVQHHNNESKMPSICQSQIDKMNQQLNMNLKNSSAKTKLRHDHQLSGQSNHIVLPKIETPHNLANKSPKETSKFQQNHNMNNTGQKSL